MDETMMNAACVPLPLQPPSIPQIRERVREFGIPRVAADSINISKRLGRIVMDAFSTIHDPRKEGMRLHRMDDSLFLILTGFLRNAFNYQKIVITVSGKEEILQSGAGLSLKYGIPSDDTLWRIMGMADPEELEKAAGYIYDKAAAALGDLFGTAGKGLRHIAIDGKAERGSGRKTGAAADSTGNGERNVQILNIYDVSASRILASRLVSCKTNEVPVAQAWISEQEDLTGTVITADALHATAKHSELISAKHGNYLFGLKGNQSGLLERARRFFTPEKKKELEGIKGRYFHESEKARGCTESRSYYICYLVDPAVSGGVAWANAKSFVCVDKTVTGRDGTVTTETRYYITSLTDLNQCADAVRKHWRIENGLHWNLDCILDEDADRTADRTRIMNRSTLKKLALYLLEVKLAVSGKEVKSKKDVLTANCCDLQDTIRFLAVVLGAAGKESVTFQKLKTKADARAELTRKRRNNAGS